MVAELVAAADGSSLSNPGPAGWAWYVDDDCWAAGGWTHGTNNMGELMAVLNLLESTAGDPRPLRVVCDSQYVINSLTKWMPGWKRRGWRKGDGKPVMNVELMKALDRALQGRQVRFEWVRGHAGHALNEAADERARAAALAFQAGRRPDVGPGFTGATTSAGEERFSIGQRDEAPDLLQVAAETEPPSTPGTASPRVKAALVARTKQLLSDEVRTDEARLSELLHPDFVSHAIDGAVVGRDHGAWKPLDDQSFDVLAIDQYADGLAGVRWRQPDRLRFNLWQRTPRGWLLRFAQVTPR
ncbi:ribonuclease H [uncultured Tessaracoccus sp.]|uniref:ribonuclease H family protein n=1 Tax=uncultured Tessaracoccus sp. TaxID=905023 RepID=UPI0025DB39B1|nr:ribonuclease H [uncultured Tessaracoccus sp.]